MPSPTDFLLYAGIPAAANIAGALISSNAAGNASDAQAQAVAQAAQLQAQGARDALNFQRQAYADQQANQFPWLNTGTAALSMLRGKMGLGALPPTPKSTLQPLSGGFGGNTGNFNVTGNGTFGAGGSNPVNTGFNHLTPGTPNYMAPSGAGNPAGTSGIGSTLLNAGISAAPFLLGALKGGTAAAGTAAGAGGLMGTIGAVAPYAAIGVLAATLGTKLWKSTQAHWQANNIVQGLENPFHYEFLAPMSQQLGQLQNSGQLDSATAQAMLNALDQGVNTYKQAANQFASYGSKQDTVAKQSLSNPALWGTVDRLRAQIVAALDAARQAEATAAAQQAQAPQTTAGAINPNTGTAVVPRVATTGYSPMAPIFQLGSLA